MNYAVYTRPILVLLFTLFLPQGAYASTTDGTIDSTFKYAWSTNAGWINFSASTGDVHVTDSTLTGYAWSSNYGWINLNPTQGGIDNDDEGDLSGFAWGASLGWIDFSGVSIDDSGNFEGTATGSIIGTLSFDCTNCAVSTDWRPLSVRTPSSPPPTSGGGGGNGSPIGSQSEDVIPDFPSTDNIASSSASTEENPSLVKPIAPATPKFPNLGTQPVLALTAALKNTRALQILLNTLGFPLAEVGPGSPGKETNVFGPLTKASLARFQAKNGIIPASGYFGPKTRAFIATLSLPPSVPAQASEVATSTVATNFIFTRDLTRGMSGLDVTALQELLIAKHTGPAAEALARSGTATNFGALTKAAVIEYQKARGITPAAGYFGSVTRNYIGAR